MVKNAKKYAEQLLDTLVNIDRTTHIAYYEMGRILHIFKNDKLYEVLKYPSFKAMVEEELSYSYGVALGYSGMYMHLKRLNYNKAEALDLLEKFGLRRLKQVLPKLNTKIGVRAFGNRVDELDEHQLSFWMRGPEYEEVVTALETCGAMLSEGGNYLNSSEALVTMAREINGTAKKRAA